STPLDESIEVVDPRGHEPVLSVFDRVSLMGAIGQLTGDQQQVLTLRYFGDMTNQEIAATTGQTEGPVKALQHRALQALQQILERESGDPPLKSRTIGALSRVE